MSVWNTGSSAFADDDGWGVLKGFDTVIASASEAIHLATKKEWIASSLRSSQ
jgi:hypothetical protein